jgi:ankyrin repeat protein
LSMMVLERAAAFAPASAPADPELQKEFGIVLLNVVEFPSDEAQSLINTLLAEGADVNVCSGRRGYAPLHGLASASLWARRSFELWQDAAAALLSAGADVNGKSNGSRAKRDTPLHALAEAASEAQDKPESSQFVLKVAAFLIQNGADPSSRNADGKTPLDLVADLHESPFKKDLSELLSKSSGRAKAIPATRPALSDAKSVALDLNECAWNVIQYPPDNAAALIEYLLRAGADPRDGMGIGEALLGGLAFNSGNTWEVSHNDWHRAGAALIKAGANVNKLRQGTPLDDAVESAALNAEYHHSTPNAIEMVKFLIENGADPTIKDEQGRTTRDRVEKIADENVRQQLLNLIRKGG